MDERTDYELYLAHDYCQQICKIKRRALGGIKMKDISTHKDLGTWWVSFPPPYHNYYMGSLEGCCKWDAICGACDYVIEQEKEKKDEH